MCKRRVSYKDKIMYNNNEAVEILVMKGHTVLVSLVDNTIEFCTLKGVDPLWCNNEQVSFTSVSDTFDMKDFLTIKDHMIGMLKEFFSANPGGFLKYQPSCPRRDKIYLRYLEKSGYTTIGYGIDEYLITYPH